MKTLVIFIAISLLSVFGLFPLIFLFILRIINFNSDNLIGSILAFLPILTAYFSIFRQYSYIQDKLEEIKGFEFFKKQFKLLLKNLLKVGLVQILLLFFGAIFKIEITSIFRELLLSITYFTFGILQIITYYFLFKDKNEPIKQISY